jgi:hypothetical protein
MPWQKCCPYTTVCGDSVEKFLNNKQFLGVDMKISFLGVPFSLQRVLIPDDASSLVRKYM